MRIGTWNLAGRWTPRHEHLMADAACDVWLLTEVSERLRLPGFGEHRTAELMRQGCRWAAVISRQPMIPLPDPHPATAIVRIDEMTYCSSILPWRGCPEDETWPGSNHAGRTANALAELLPGLPTDGLVWGGDWNHALSGTEAAGSKGGREHVLAVVEKLGMQVPTAGLPHRIDGHLSIDHIAVPSDWVLIGATRIDASGLSDHDCYVIEVEEP